LGSVVLLVVFFAALSQWSRTGTGEGDQIKTVSAQATPSTPPALDVAQEERRRKRLAELKSHFIEAKDEFSSATVIRHRAFNRYVNYNGTTLFVEIVRIDVPPGIAANTARIKAVKALKMISVYVSEHDWIFQESFTVKVGDLQLTAKGKTDREVIFGGGLYETVTASLEDSKAIAGLIMLAQNHPMVRVRLMGTSYQKDYTLRLAHQMAIAETAEYYELLEGADHT